MPLILGANSVSGGYNVANSLRFNSGSSDNLSRTPASTGNQQIFTYSGWIKRASMGVGSAQTMLGCNDAPGYVTIIQFTLSNELRILSETPASEASFITNQLFRDPSAWYHIVVAFDTTQATSSNRTKIYLNGTQITSFSTETYIAQNTNCPIFLSGRTSRLGGRAGADQLFNGYMSEIYFIDGQQLTPSSFGETDTDTNIWKPKAYTGSFGTNGFYLDFEDSANLGNDMSGNNNDFTVNNLTSIDQSTDTCTNNFCTLNPLTNTGVTVSEGNLKGVYSTNDANLRCTFGVNKGKWYWESKSLGTASGLLYGIIIENTPQTIGRADSAGIYGLQNAGTSFAYADTNGSRATSAGFPNPVANDIIQCALDLDNDKFYMGINGTFYNLSGTTANPATGSNPTWTLDSSYDGVIWFPFYEFRSSAESTELNFGNPPFTIASGNADANGFGNFEYAVPSGYYALCTKNLANFG